MDLRKWIGVGAVVFFSLPAIAEDITAQAPAAAESKIVGSVDIRPSVKSKVGSNHLENTVEAGYQFKKGHILTAVQYWENNLHSNDPAAEGTTLYDTFLRARVNKFAHLAEGLYLSIQTRTYLPVTQASRDKGMVAIFRNYITLTQKVNDVFTLTLSELPIFHAYSVPGVNGKANPVYENRVYLIGDFQLTEKLSLSVPLMFHQTKARNFEGAANSGAWSYFLWTYPELTYETSSNTSVGFAYYSSNLVQADLSGLSIGDGLEDGVFQLVFGASL